MEKKKYIYKIQIINFRYDWCYTAKEIADLIYNMEPKPEDIYYILNGNVNEVYNKFMKWVFPEKKNSNLYVSLLSINTNIYKLIRETENEQETIAIAAYELKPTGKFEDIEIFWYI